VGKFKVEGVTFTLQNDHSACGGGGPGGGCPEHDHIIAGSLELLNDGEDWGTLVFENHDHIIDGDGSTDGMVWGEFIPLEDFDEDVGPRVKIDDGVEVTNELGGTTFAQNGFRSRLNFEPLQASPTTLPVFINEGRVDSDRGGIVLHEDMELEDIDGAIWDANFCKPIVFKRQELGLEGNLHAGDGILEFEASIKTCGWLSMGSLVSCGTLLFFNNSSLEYAEFEDEGCSNPGTVVGTATCANPYFVDTDDEGDCGGDP